MPTCWQSTATEDDIRTHIPPKNITPHLDIQLQPYEMQGLPDEYIHCIHCGEMAYDYEGTDQWPIGYDDFAKVHEKNARWMRRVGITDHEPHLQLSGQISERKTSLHICPMCGWWLAVDKAVLPAIGSQLWLVSLVCNSVLVDFDPVNIEQPMTEVRMFLRRHYERRYALNPCVYEKTVASVFRDIGYRSEVTAYSNDGGIDVVLFGDDGKKIGVQVKRQQRAVEVEQIRAFLGARTLGGYDRGVFVSTSRYRRGAVRAAEQSSRQHIPIELIDPARFFDMLGIAQLSDEPDPDTCGFYQAKKPKFVPYGHLNLSTL